MYQYQHNISYVCCLPCYSWNLLVTHLSSRWMIPLKAMRKMEGFPHLLFIPSPLLRAKPVTLPAVRRTRYLVPCTPMYVYFNASDWRFLTVSRLVVRMPSPVFYTISHIPGICLVQCGEGCRAKRGRTAVLLLRLLFCVPRSVNESTWGTTTVLHFADSSALDKIST